MGAPGNAGVKGLPGRGNGGIRVACDFLAHENDLAIGVLSGGIIAECCAVGCEKLTDGPTDAKHRDRAKVARLAGPVGNEERQFGAGGVGPLVERRRQLPRPLRQTGNRQFFVENRVRQWRQGPRRHRDAHGLLPQDALRPRDPQRGRMDSGGKGILARQRDLDTERPVGVNVHRVDKQAPAELGPARLKHGQVARLELAEPIHHPFRLAAEIRQTCEAIAADPRIGADDAEHQLALPRGVKLTVDQHVFDRRIECFEVVLGPRLPQPFDAFGDPSPWGDVVRRAASRSLRSARIALKELPSPPSETKTGLVLRPIRQRPR